MADLTLLAAERPDGRLCAAVSLSLFDGFRVASAAERISLPPAAQRLVAFLGLRTRATREEAAGTLWPDATEGHASGSLRTAVWRLQRACPGLVDPAGDSVTIGTGVRVDVRAWTTSALRLVDNPKEAGAFEMSSPALGGELLPGWYDDWVLLERERLRQLRLHVLEIAADQLLAAGRYAAALEAALMAIRIEPLRESAHRLVIRVHLAEHNIVEAKRQYETCRRLLADELGVCPSPALQHLM